MPGLAELHQLDGAKMWEAAHLLLSRLSGALDRNALMDECLDIIIDVLGADRGLLMLDVAESGTITLNARSQGRALTPFEREEISRTLIKEVLESGECQIWSRLEDTATPQSMAELGIMTALAAPLRPFAPKAGARGLQGVLYTDFRHYRKRIGPNHKAFFEAITVLLAGILQQDVHLQLVREDLRQAEARSRLPGPSLNLDQLLTFPSMAAIREEIAAVLHSDAPILILGESGTGKTLLAQAIAEARQRLPVVRAMLGASDDLNSIASELFGHERGAFSGAIQKRPGTVEFAHGGTLILDEILNLPAHTQQLLLDFTQFGTYRPLGYSKPDPKHADVCLITVTNGDLQDAINKGKFRQDLYYRLAGVTLVLPALRERREEIPALAQGYLRRLDARPWRLSAPLRRLLLSKELEWPGNIRQLHSIMQRARSRAIFQDPEANILLPTHVKPADFGRRELSVPARGTLEDESAPICAQFQLAPEDLRDSLERLNRERLHLDALEAQILTLAVQNHNGTISQAARELDMARTSLISRLNALGVKRS